MLCGPGRSFLPDGLPEVRGRPERLTFHDESDDEHRKEDIAAAIDERDDGVPGRVMLADVVVDGEKEEGIEHGRDREQSQHVDQRQARFTLLGDKLAVKKTAEKVPDQLDEVRLVIVDKMANPVPRGHRTPYA